MSSSWHGGTSARIPSQPNGYARRGSADAVTTRGDLVGHPLIGDVPDLLYAPELDYLGEVDARLRATLRSSSIIAQSELIAAGAGYGVLPCFIGDAVPALARLLPDQVAITRTFWLVTHRDARRIARIEAFITGSTRRWRASSRC